MQGAEVWVCFFIAVGVGVAGFFMGKSEGKEETDRHWGNRIGVSRHAIDRLDGSLDSIDLLAVQTIVANALERQDQKSDDELRDRLNFAVATRDEYGKLCAMVRESEADSGPADAFLTWDELFLQLHPPDRDPRYD